MLTQMKINKDKALTAEQMDFLKAFIKGQARSLLASIITTKEGERADPLSFENASEYVTLYALDTFLENHSYKGMALGLTLADLDDPTKVKIIMEENYLTEYFYKPYMVTPGFVERFGAIV